jgi:hypothetical protein
MNLVRNGGFDRDTSGWIAESTLELTTAAMDAANCSGSLSAQITYGRPVVDFQPEILQCIPNVTSGQRYNVGAWVRGSADSPAFRIELWVNWYRQPGCRFEPGVVPESAAKQLPGPESIGGWRHLSLDALAPPGTVSATVSVRLPAMETSTKPIRATADLVYFTPVPGRW